jgi:inorganic pyrophosphatase
VDFWNSLSNLIVNDHIVIDRPKGSRHPRYADMIYPLDYGYIAHTTTSDREGIDVWVGTGNHRVINGLICTLDTQKRDAEMKILIGCTEAEIEAVLDFLKQNSLSPLLVRRDMYD